MAERIAELKIERLAGLGDGIGISSGRKVFVPYTAAGDVISARIVKETTDAAYGRIENIISLGTGRITPVCRHFGTCGGCALQHIATSLYIEFKQGMAQEAVRKAGFSPNVVEPLITFPAASRRRADLKVNAGQIGFYAGQSHRIVDMQECKVLEPNLFALVMRIKEQLPNLSSITAIQLNGVDGGYDVVVEGGGGEKLQDTAIRRLSVREEKTIKTLYQSEEVTVTLNNVKVVLPAGAFLQACKQAQEIMTKLITDATCTSSTILDLFAGIGTYSFPLSVHAHVTAIEGDRAMTEAITNATSKNILSHNIKAEVRDLFSNPVKAAALNHYDALVINPPRAGAKAQAEEIARSEVATVVMVSCNPATFARDARLLKEGGYQLKRLTPIDQFVYSSHLELVAEFRR